MPKLYLNNIFTKIPQYEQNLFLITLTYQYLSSYIVNTSQLSHTIIPTHSICYSTLSNFLLNTLLVLINTANTRS
jgi:hypothetical protein